MTAGLRSILNALQALSLRDSLCSSRVLVLGTPTSRGPLTLQPASATSTLVRYSGLCSIVLHLLLAVIVVLTTHRRHLNTLICKRLTCNLQVLMVIGCSVLVK